MVSEWMMSGWPALRPPSSLEIKSEKNVDKVTNFAEYRRNLRNAWFCLSHTVGSGYNTKHSMGGSSSEITTLLAKLRSGNDAVKIRLASLVYDDLRRIAGRHMKRERFDHTLQATALVHEAYLELVSQDKKWENRSHFFAIASSLMRRILVDYARAHRAQKRGGGNTVHVRVDELKNEFLAFIPARGEELLALDESLSRLTELDARQCHIVEMRFFGGMTDTEIAEALGISVRTVLREWALARAWLHAELSK